jgi:hypothetical protein
MTGSESQVEWAERIRLRVGAEFDRVIHALQSVALHQQEARRAETEAIIAIARSKRAEVMSNDEAGYFIRVWQEINDQVRQMIMQDPRYREIREGRDTRHPSRRDQPGSVSDYS